MKKYYMLLVAMHILGFTEISSGTPIEDILDLSQGNYLDTHNAVYYEMDVDKTYESTAPINGTKETCQITYCQRNDDADVKIHRVTLDQNATPKQDYVGRYLILNQEFINYRFRPDTPPSYITIDSRKEILPDYKKSSLLYNAGLGRILDGYYFGFGNQTVIDLLKDGRSSIRSSEMTLDGHQTVLLEYESKYGKLKVWLDPECGYNMRKISLTKQTGNLYVDEPLGTIPSPLPDGAVTHIPYAAIESIEFTVDAVELEKIGDSYVAVSATVSENIRYQTGEYLNETVKCTRSNITFEPDFEELGAFQLEIPNGTDVFFKDVRGVSGVEYEWFDGKPRGKVDDGFIGQIDAEVIQMKDNIELQAIRVGTKPDIQGDKVSDDERIIQVSVEKEGVNKSTFSRSILLMVTALLIAGSITGWLLFQRKV